MLISQLINDHANALLILILPPACPPPDLLGTCLREVCNADLHADMSTGILRIPDGLNAFKAYSSHWIEGRIGGRIAKCLGENYVHTISFHTGGFTNKRVRTVCQGLRHYVKWSRPSPLECWECWSTYLWGCVEYHDPEEDYE